MKCDEIEILISAYIDGEVTEVERQIVEEHVKVCSYCRVTLAEFAELHTLSHELARQEAPPGFRQRVSGRLDAKPRFAFSWSLSRWVYGFSFVLLTMCSVAIIAFYVMKDVPTPEQTWDQASLEIEVYAEDILFDQEAGFGEEDLFSESEISIPEEILSTINFLETDTSFFDVNPSSNELQESTYA